MAVQPKHNRPSGAALFGACGLYVRRGIYCRHYYKGAPNMPFGLSLFIALLAGGLLSAVCGFLMACRRCALKATILP